MRKKYLWIAVLTWCSNDWCVIFSYEYSRCHHSQDCSKESKTHCYYSYQLWWIHRHSGDLYTLRYGGWRHHSYNNIIHQIMVRKRTVSLSITALCSYSNFYITVYGCSWISPSPTLDSLTQSWWSSALLMGLRSVWLSGMWWAQKLPCIRKSGLYVEVYFGMPRFGARVASHNLKRCWDFNISNTHTHLWGNQYTGTH